MEQNQCAQIDVLSGSACAVAEDPEANVAEPSLGSWSFVRTQRTGELWGQQSSRAASAAIHSRSEKREIGGETLTSKEFRLWVTLALKVL